MPSRRPVAAILPPAAAHPKRAGLDVYALLVEPDTTAAEVATGDHDDHLSDLHAAALAWGVQPILRALRLRRAALVVASVAGEPDAEEG